MKSHDPEGVAGKYTDEMEPGPGGTNDPLHRGGWSGD